MVGPTGGVVRTLVADPIHPSTVYAGGDLGLFKSNDDGESWVAIQPAQIGTAIRSLAVDAADPRWIYAGTAHYGLYVSADGGLTWRGDPEDQSTIRTVTIGPTGTVYVGSDSFLLISGDHGETWSGANIGFDAFVEAVATDPRDPGIVYVAYGGAGLFRTTNGGQTWLASGGLDPAGYVYDVKVDSGDPTVIYAEIVDGEGQQQLLQSPDRGEHWRDILPGALLMAIDTLHSTTLYALRGQDLVVSFDRGQSWTTRSTTGRPSGTVFEILSDRAIPGRLFLATSDGIFVSSAGSPWTSSNTGLSNFWLQTVALSPTDSSVVYVGTPYWNGNGVYRSTDRGRTWSKAAIDVSVASMAIDPLDGTVLYIGSDDGKFLKTADGGQNWSVYALADGLTAITLLAVDPVVPANVYAGDLDGRLLKSSDGGATWETLLTLIGPPHALTIDPRTSTTLYLDPGDPDPIGISLDGGQTWDLLQPGVAGTIVVDPVDSSTLYRFGRSGLFKTTTMGAAWQRIPFPEAAGRVTSLVVDPRAPSRLYAGTEHAGVLTSRNGGATWIALDDGFDASLAVQQVLLDLFRPRTLYASTGRGLYRFDGSGADETVGDCNGDGRVNIDELMTAVRIALAPSELPLCVAADADGSNTVTIEELVTAVENALNA